MNERDATKRVSVEEYLANEVRAEYKSEYHNGIVVPVHRMEDESGQIVAMAGASPSHNLLVGALVTLLNNCLANQNCLVFPSDQLVHTPACEKYFYPDITVVCTPPAFEKHPQGLDALQNPSIIIEVLSKNTEGYDRSEKFRCYRTLPSFGQYVLVDSTERLVETFTKQDDKHWLMTIAREPDEKVKIGSCEFLVEEIYKKVFLE